LTLATLIGTVFAHVAMVKRYYPSLLNPQILEATASLDSDLATTKTTSSAASTSISVGSEIRAQPSFYSAKSECASHAAIDILPHSPEIPEETATPGRRFGGFGESHEEADLAPHAPIDAEPTIWPKEIADPGYSLIWLPAVPDNHSSGGFESGIPGSSSSKTNAEIVSTQPSKESTFIEPAKLYAGINRRLGSYGTVVTGNAVLDDRIVVERLEFPEDLI
ncbi:hypothetical protein IWW55_001470, partial [Coemansia sp. RSA 2706]